MLDTDRWQQIQSIYYAALEREPGERSAFLDEACLGDEQLRREVNSLLSSHDQAGSFLVSPALEIAAKDLAEQADPVAGCTLGAYKIVSLLGRGGMGEVYLARDTRLGRKVALKLLPVYFTKDQDRLRRFQQEARAASALNHPGIITIYEIGQADTIHYIATELIQGETLRQRILRGKISVMEALEIAVQVAGALAAAHEAGIVHRDIKPENIMVRPDGYVKVLDFGLAKLVEQKASMDTEVSTRMGYSTEAGVVMGTTSYMSPEQARGMAVDGRTDVWSLGVVMYEMASGRLPFEGETASDVIASILKTVPPLVSHYVGEAPAELDRITSKALSKERDERYQRIEEMAIDLKQLKRQIELGYASLDTSDKAKTSSIAAPQQSAAQTNSIAVLPFMTLGMDGGDEYLGMGLADALITQLGNAKQIIVRPTSAVRRHTDAQRDSIAIGRELRVGAVLEGNIQRAGERVRVTVQLVSVRDEVPLWADKFNARFTDILDVQDAIAEQVANALTLKLNSEEQRRLTKRYTENMEAYQAYLKGRYHWNRFTPDGIKKSIDYFNQAIALDPSYTLAYFGLADSYGMLAHILLPPREAYPKAKWAAAKALELDDALAEAHAAMASVYMFYDWDWAAAYKEARLALTLNPNSVAAHLACDLYLKTMGRYEEQLAEARQAQELDPLSLIVNVEIGEALTFAGRWDEAIEQGRKTLEIDSYFFLTYQLLGRAYELKGMYEEAFQQYQRVIEIFGREPVLLSWLGHHYGLSGKPDEARKILDELNEMSALRYVPSYLIASIYAGLGDKDQAFGWLEKAFEERFFLLIWIKGDPRFDSLRSDARYSDLLARLGLA